jgi:hypothetical protein
MRRIHALKYVKIHNFWPHRILKYLFIKERYKWKKRIG